MRAADPFWEPDRPTTSSLYKARVSTQGRIFCTRRMQRWLHTLPDRPEARSEPLPPEPCPEPPSMPRPPRSIRPRAQSAPAPRPPGPASPGPGTDLSISHSRFGHPNPLSQHPVQLQRVPSQLDTPLQLEEVHSRLEDNPELEVHPQLGDLTQPGEVLPKLEEVHPRLEEVPLRLGGCHFQPNIPQRRSSLYFSSQPASRAPQSHHPLSQFGDLFQGLEQPQIGENNTSESEQSQEQGETCENGSVTSQPKCEANMGILTRPASKRHTIHFGSNLGEMQTHLPAGNPQKNGRAQVSSQASTSMEEIGIGATNLILTRAMCRAPRLPLMTSVRSPQRAFSAPLETDAQP